MFYLQKCINEVLKLTKGKYKGLINLTVNYIELQWWQKKCWLSKLYLSTITSANNILRYLSKWLGAACRKHSVGGNWSKKESSYNIEPEAIGIDAFSYRWSNETFYAFLLYAILSQVFSKTEAEMATGVLIVPLFTTQSWFTRLLRLLIHEALLIP